MRKTLKAAMRGLALVLVSPAVCSFQIRQLVLGRDRAIMGSTQVLSLIPGVLGQYVRTAFLRCALPRCDRSVVVEFGTILSSANACFGENVYIGPMCHIGLVELERDVLVGAAVHIPSGPETHGIADVNRPIREQAGVLRRVRIGSGSWIGSGSIVMHDIGAHTVVAAGAVVTQPVPSMVVAGGVPARVLQQRGGLPG